MNRGSTSRDTETTEEVERSLQRQYNKTSQEENRRSEDEEYENQVIMTAEVQTWYRSFGGSDAHHDAW